MSTYRVALMAALCLLVPFGRTFAQSRADQAAPQMPGVRYKGQSIGYVPAHLRGQQDKPRPRPSADDEAASMSIDPTSAISQVGYEQPGDPPLPPGFDGELIEITEDIKGIDPWLGDNSCYWMRAEYLLWWTQGMSTPPLVTTSPAGTPQAQAGVLGQPGTTTLFGNGNLADGARSGGRFTFGKWLDDAHCNGIEVNYLTLGSATDSFHSRLNQFNILARPFIDTVGPAEDSRLIAFPGLVQGTLNVSASTELQGVEVLYRRPGCESWGCHIDWVLGYRFVELKDRLRIDESTASLAGPIAGATFDLFDQFDTRSTFHGAEFGLVGDWRIDNCWSCETLAKIALGGSTYRANISGQTITTDAAGASTTVPRGLLAQSTNSGSYRWDDFAAMAEFGISLRRELACGFSATFGYNFLYLSCVARPGDQVDRTINTSQIPLGNLVGTARPAFPQRNDDFWAQGLRFGLEYRY